MSTAGLFKRAARGLGLEVTRYAPDRSRSAQMSGLLGVLGVDLVLDVGANIGQYAGLVRNYGYSGRIVSFEPLSEAHAQLQLASAADPAWDVAERVALGTEERTIEINVSANSQSSSILEMSPEHLEAAPESRYVSRETVRMARLDEIARPFVGADSRVFLKIDTQGYEAEVLKGATALLPRIVGLQLELSFVELYQGEWSFQRMVDYLDTLGFELVALWPAFVDPHSFRTLQVDGVFARPATGAPGAAV